MFIRCFNYFFMFDLEREKKFDTTLAVWWFI